MQKDVAYFQQIEQIENKYELKIKIMNINNDKSNI